jgi:putative CocE/NonD family hydrolase
MAPHAIGDSYFETLHYPGGAFQLALSLVSAVMFSATVGTVIYDQGTIFTRDLFRHLPLIDLDVQAIGREIPFWRDWLAHPTYDDYWQAITHRHAYERIDVPIFQQSGWYDPYVAGMFRMQQAMIEQGGSPRARKHQKVLIGPWTHSEPASSCLGDLDFGPSARVVFPELELPWFDYWLKGIDTGIAEQPPICIFVMGFNRWRFESEWPLDRAEPTPYYLRSNGRANSIYGDGVLSRELPASEPPDHFDYDPANPVPTLGGVHSLGYAMQNSPDPVLVGPVDQRPIARRDDVLVYTTRPLERAVEATGPIEFVLYAASSALDTDFTVSLLDVGPTGFSVPVSEGIIRGRYRLGFDQMEFLERDEPTEFRIQMSPTSNVFQKGHRIRVHVSSSNFPHFSRNLNTGENVATSVRMRVAHQTVLHSSDFPSHIVLPLVPIDGPEGAG